MGRKRLTQLFPWLLPLRKWQRNLFFYGKMRRDGAVYAKTKQSERLPYLCYRWQAKIVNPDTGYDIKYQENKAHNLRLACETISGVVISPGETFSFWQLVRHAEEREKYREGLNLVDGKIVFTLGGGLCQLSNELFWCFLHTPLTIVERHPHRVQDFPLPPEGKPVGTDAAVSEGWLDLKMRNGTSARYQAVSEVCGDCLICEVYCDRPVNEEYEIIASDVQYLENSEGVWQRAKLYRRVWDRSRPAAPRSEHWLYENRTRIGYEIQGDKK